MSQKMLRQVSQVMYDIFSGKDVHARNLRSSRRLVLEVSTEWALIVPRSALLVKVEFWWIELVEFWWIEQSYKISDFAPIKTHYEKEYTSLELKADEDF